VTALPVLIALWPRIVVTQELGWSDV
jgi:hypothetical protein